MKSFAIAVLALAAFVIAPAATAAVPVLLSVGSVDGHPTATWELPPAVHASVVEVATSAATDSDGYFYPENVQTSGALQEKQTSWTSDRQVDPGTYYVHVGGWDPKCMSCQFELSDLQTRQIGWSDTQTLIIAGAPPPPPPPPPPPLGEPPPIAGQGYSVRFADEFDTLNPAVWDDHIWYDGPPRPDWAGFQTVENGVLHLRTSRNFHWGPGPTDVWPTNTVTTHSSDKTFQYGYFEARLKWTKGTGAWPAFWLISDNWANVWPFQCATGPWAGELDIFEGQGSEPDVFYGTVHLDSSNQCFPDQQNANNYQPTGVDLTADFHTYAMLWTASTVSWYLDDRLLMIAPTFSTLNQKMMLLLQMWVGGWTSDPNSTTPETLETQVDWVHVWQK